MSLWDDILPTPLFNKSAISSHIPNLVYAYTTIHTKTQLFVLSFSIIKTYNELCVERR